MFFIRVVVVMLVFLFTGNCCNTPPGRIDAQGLVRKLFRRRMQKAYNLEG